MEIKDEGLPTKNSRSYIALPSVFKTDSRGPRMVALTVLFCALTFGFLVGPYNSQARTITQEHNLKFPTDSQFITVHLSKLPETCLGYFETNVSGADSHKISTIGKLLMNSGTKSLLADISLRGDFSITSEITNFSSVIDLGKTKLTAFTKKSTPNELQIFLTSKSITKVFTSEFPRETRLIKNNANGYTLQTSNTITNLISSTIKEKDLILRQANENDFTECKTQLTQLPKTPATLLPNAGIYLKLMELTPPRKLVTRGNFHKKG
jgi:hypothetical protein